MAIITILIKDKWWVSGSNEPPVYWGLSDKGERAQFIILWGCQPHPQPAQWAWADGYLRNITPSISPNRRIRQPYRAMSRIPGVRLPVYYANYFGVARFVTHFSHYLYTALCVRGCTYWPLYASSRSCLCAPERVIHWLARLQSLTRD